MTKEELNYIKDALSQIIDDIAGNPDWHEAARAVASDLGTLERKLEEKISPLSSNLDEAAERMAWDIAPNYPDISWDTCFEKIKAGIKAGAELMAGQGETKDGFVAAYDNGRYRVYTAFLEENSKFKFGDKVVVQIRKK